ncbi:RGG repeats nuclear RNA binding protein B [Linum grandiflorum]
MATLNPFDLLGDDDNDDPSQLIASVQLRAEKEKAQPAAADKAQLANNKLGGKQQPAASAKSMNPLHSARNEGGAGRARGDRGGSTGRSYGGGEGRGVYKRDYNKEFESGNSNGYQFKPATDAERKPRAVVGGSRSGPGGRGPRRGGEETGEGQRQRRVYDRHSGTGRGSDMKRNGSGSGNWGKDDELVPIEENAPVENDANDTAEKQQPDVEGDAADANKDSPPKEEEQKEPEDNEMTLDEWEKVREEKRKALLSLKTAEERKVDAKAFAAMQQLSCKKENDEIFAKLGAEKEKKREAAEREEKAKKAVSINEFLKPAEGETYRGGRGGRGRGRGGRGGGNDRGGYGGGYGRDVSAPSIEDPGQFPSLGGGK